MIRINYQEIKMKNKQLKTQQLLNRTFSLEKI